MQLLKAKRYVVNEDCLPKALRLTARAKELISDGNAGNVDEAVKAVGIARSTFYKYKDSISAFYELSVNGIVNFSMTLQNRTGILSGVLNAVASCGGNILTINQGLPSLNGAVVTMSVGMGEANVSTQDLFERLMSVYGVSEIRIDGIKN